MSYDRKCWLLAGAFLDDEHDLNTDKGNTHKLAQAIQDTIEDWMSEAREETKRKAEQEMS